MTASDVANNIGGMTAVVASRILGTPTLVGDVVLSHQGERLEDDFTCKLCIITSNVALGWSGRRAVAASAVARLRRALTPNGPASINQLNAALDALADLRGPGRPALELIGWLVPPENPQSAQVFRWHTAYEPVRHSMNDGYAGDGGQTLSKMFAEPEIEGFGNSTGHDTVPLKAIGSFMEARFGELLGHTFGEEPKPISWPKTWGAAYDAIVYQEGSFRWMPKLTYVGWTLKLDGTDGIVSFEQAPVVVTQARVHDCTVFYSTKGSGVSRVHVAQSVDAEARDLEMYRRRPHSVTSPYYANWFILVRPDGSWATTAWATVNATSNGPMWHAGRNESDPSFALNPSLLEPKLRDVMRRLREKQARLAIQE